jgi:hypothetical protein
MSQKYKLVEFTWPKHMEATLSAVSVSRTFNFDISEMKPDHCKFGQIEKIRNGVYSMEITEAAFERARQSCRHLQDGPYIFESSTIMVFPDRTDLKGNYAHRPGAGTLINGH